MEGEYAALSKAIGERHKGDVRQIILSRGYASLFCQEQTVTYRFHGVMSVYVLKVCSN